MQSLLNNGKALDHSSGKHFHTNEGMTSRDHLPFL